MHKLEKVEVGLGGGGDNRSNRGLEEELSRFAGVIGEHILWLPHSCRFIGGRRTGAIKAL